MFSLSDFWYILKETTPGKEGTEPMEPTVSIGTQSFEFIRQENAFYIDKTGFIREWWARMR